MLKSQFKFWVTEYYSLPQLYRYDDYDRCLEENSLYCLVDAVIKPNRSIDLWNVIEKFSNDTKHFFRHDHLQRGVCVNRCKALLGKFDKATQLTYYLDKFDNIVRVSLFKWLERPNFEFLGNEFQMPLDPNTFRHALEYRLKFDKLLNECINYELKTYHLMAHSKVEYCSKKDEYMPIG